MKRTRFFAGALALVFAMSLPLASCSNDDDDNNNTSAEKSEAEAELENSAFSVLRSLCNLAQFDENAATDDDGEYTGVETLPSNWQSITFTCDQGYVLGDDETVRSIATAGTDDARAFFSDMIGESVEDDSYTWSCPGFGTLSYKEVTDDASLYATVDVAIDVLPGVSQLNFVPYDVIKGAGAENSYKGEPYYHAGDVIKRTKDDTFWICVRPAGGPLYKDKSYWICLNPYDKKDKSLITGETKKVTLSVYDDENGFTGETTKQTWKYAKNLMSLKTAQAAAFTFLCLAKPSTNTIFKGCSETYQRLKNIGFDLLQLSCSGRVEDGKVDEYTLEGMGAFVFVYGKPKNDSKRLRVADVKYVQPYLAVNGEKGTEKALQASIKTFRFNNDKPLCLYSVTDVHDVWYAHDDVFGGIYDDPTPYNYEDYLFKYLPNNLTFTNRNKLVNTDSPLAPVMTIELCINDNKGKVGVPKKPSSAYEDCFVQNDSASQFDYWAARQNTQLFIDDVEANWQKE